VEREATIVSHLNTNKFSFITCTSSLSRATLIIKIRPKEGNIYLKSIPVLVNMQVRDRPFHGLNFYVQLPIGYCSAQKWLRVHAVSIGNSYRIVPLP
jgi:hypothetical protein